jgi:hypothetical protein
VIRHKTQVLAAGLNGSCFRFELLAGLVEVEFLVAEEKGVAFLYQ